MSNLSKTESQLIMILRQHQDPVKAFATAVQIISEHLEGTHNEDNHCILA